jgi:Flp pilus assembly CpaE family ATPase
MLPAVTRPAIAVLLPASERATVAAEIRQGGFDALPVADAIELEALLGARRDVLVAIVDAGEDEDAGQRAWRVLHQRGRNIPALLVVGPSTLDRLDVTAPGREDDEYLTRPYSAESIRWRIEAMCIRSVVEDDGSGPVLQGPIDSSGWSRRGQLLAVFNPKGGVGKTTLAMNLSAALVSRGQGVLLVDADTVTGHVTTSLGMEGVATVVDAWRDELEGGPVQTFDELASQHASGLKVLALSASPIHTEILEPQRVAGAVTVARRHVDYVVVDLHPSYSPLNRALFDRADRILVPVTPDLPAIRAVVQLRDVADELGMRDRLALVVNRANSGVALDDLERTVGLPAYAQVRSSGLLLVKAANEGRTVVEMAPKEPITQDFLVLADRVMGLPEPVPDPSRLQLLRLFSRQLARA